MRTTPPHPLVRFRLALLIVALAALALAAGLLVSRSSVSFAVARPVALLALLFVWGNGAFWWLELRYPFLPVEGGFTSRVESGSPSRRVQFAFFAGCYGVGALLATFACLGLAFEA